MIIKQKQKQHIEDEDILWTLESPTIISRTGSLSTSTAISIGIWPIKYWKKKEKKTHKYFKCDKEEHIAKDCKEKPSMKKQKIQEESDDEDNKEEDKKQSFGEDIE